MSDTDIEVVNEFENVKTQQPIDKKKAASMVGVIGLLLAAFGGIVYYQFSGNAKSETSTKEMSVSKPVETDLTTDPTLQFNKEQLSTPPGMVNVVAETTAPQTPTQPTPAEQAAAEQAAKDKALLDARYKSQIVITGGNGQSVNGTDNTDPSSIKKLPPELQAVYGAMGMMGANGGNGSNQPQNTVPDVSTQGGRFNANSGSSNLAPSSYASRIDNRAYKITQGKIIDVIILNGMNSDLPGQVIGQVTEPVYGDIGRYQLLPAGTRLFGEYSSNVRYGQSVIAVKWARAITPQGVQINLDSPGANGLGIAGIDGGTVNNHFFQTFGTAALLSVIGAGASSVNVNSSDQNNSMSSYRAALTQSMANQANTILGQRANIPPTIKVREGTPSKVLIAKDLDFTSLFNE